jgi:hypothetical protein
MIRDQNLSNKNAQVPHTEILEIQIFKPEMIMSSISISITDKYKHLNKI